MITSSFVFSPHDAPLSEISPPAGFENIDLYPSVAFIASRQKVAKFCRLVTRDDEHGNCLVSHFEIFGTLLVLYQSALDPKEGWTVFVDMRGCIEKQQVPTKIGKSMVRYLTAGSIKPDWINEAVDAVYRSGRRKLLKGTSDTAESGAKVGTSFRRTTSGSPRTRDVFIDLPVKRKTITEADRMRILNPKKVVTSGVYATKKTTTTPSRTATAKKAVAPKKATSKKAAAFKK